MAAISTAGRQPPEKSSADGGIARVESYESLRLPLAVQVAGAPHRRIGRAHVRGADTGPRPLALAATRGCPRRPRYIRAHCWLGSGAGTARVDRRPVATFGYRQRS